MKLQNNKKESLTDLIDPARFRDVVSAARKVDGFNEESHRYTTPTR